MPDPTPPTTFLLVRHAQTVWNKERRHAGSVEVELSDQAERQILRLTKSLTHLSIQAYYSSPLSRCQLTIGPSAALKSLPVIIDARLIERRLGSWEGKQPDELLPTHPGYEFPFSAYNGQFRITGAEPLDEVERRLRSFLCETHLTNPGQTVAVSTHSGAIWTIINHIVTNPPETHFWPGNCSVSTVVTSGNHYRFEGIHGAQ